MKAAEKTIAMSTHQAMMKCPWQWRPAFLDERRESRKRKAGDGNLYDPVDPGFVDHLLPVYAKRFCSDVYVESEEKEKIEKEIERLKAQQRMEEGTSLALVEVEMSRDRRSESDSVKGDSILCTAIRRLQKGLISDMEIQDNVFHKEANQENMRLADSILLMSKRAIETRRASSEPRIDLVSDNIDENYLVVSGVFDFTMELLA